MAEEIDLSFLDEGERTTGRPTVEQLGYSLRQEQKARKAAEKELKETQGRLGEYEAERRANILKAADLNEFHQEAFVKFYEDVTPENLAAYRAKAGLAAEVPTESEEEPEEQEPEREPGAPAARPFTPTSTGGTGPSAKTWDRQEWLKLAGSDPEQARKLWREGKVDLSDVYSGLGPDK